MSRKVVLALVLLGWTTGLGASVPSGREVTRLGPDLFSSVEGTTWEGMGSVAYTVYRFEKGGILEYSYNGTTYRNGTWKQKDAAIYLEANQKFWEFEGRMKDDVITGKAWNQPGQRWQLTMKRRGRP
jgi:hypothetical protein